MSTAYTVSLSEQQRKLLEQVLGNYAGTPNNSAHMQLLTMLENLPQAEKQMQALGHAPGAAVHGFAL